MSWEAMFGIGQAKVDDPAITQASFAECVQMSRDLTDEIDRLHARMGGAEFRNNEETIEFYERIFRGDDTTAAQLREWNRQDRSGFPELNKLHSEACTRLNAVRDRMRDLALGVAVEVPVAEPLLYKAVRRELTPEEIENREASGETVEIQHGGGQWVDDDEDEEDDGEEKDEDDDTDGDGLDDAGIGEATPPTRPWPGF